MIIMEIKEAKKEDLQGIYDLYLEVMGYDYPLEKMNKMLKVINASNCNYLFIASDNLKVIGVIEVVIKYSIHKDPYLIINTLAVLSNYQGKGVGGQLLNYVEKFAKKNQLSSITLGSQFKRKTAHQFYLNHGFKIIKDHKIFEKRL